MYLKYRVMFCYHTMIKCGGPRGCVKILLLTVVALCVFIFSIQLNDSKVSLSSLGPAFTLMQSNGQMHIDDLQGFEGTSDENKIYLMNTLRHSIKDLMKNCSYLRQQQIDGCPSYQHPGKLLTLFTTWVYDKMKFPINNKTMHNWKTLPNVNLVVFMDPGDVNVEKFSLLAGLDVLPVRKEASGTPVLPTMFQDVMQKYRSKYYAFANGDVLFTGQLLETLDQISCQVKNGKIDDSKGLLIVGRRTNIPAGKLTDAMAVSWPELTRLSDQHGELFQADAEDFFITDAKYPWHSFLPVAVGRRGFDNWIVAYSRYTKITTIDASESVLCLHQTLESRGNYEGLSKGTYNMDLVNKQNMPFPFTWGKTMCTQWKIWYDLCGRLVVSLRKQLDQGCTSIKWSYKVKSFFGLI